MSGRGGLPSRTSSVAKEAQMSIGVQCQSCGRRYRVADDRAGGAITCECGQAVVVEGTQYIDKLCAGCGIDLGSLTRTRDSQGNYYCQECWDERMKAQRAATDAAREPEMAWITQQLSQVSAKLLRPLLLLALLALFAGSYQYPELGKYAGGTMLVGGVVLLGVWAVWVYAMPFRDGWEVGLDCLTDKGRRREWMKKNPDYQLHRPGTLVATAITMLILSAGYFALAFRVLRQEG
jgi:hypothetical protein